MNAPCAVLIAPDRTTTYLAPIVDAELDAMHDGDVLEVRLPDPAARRDLAEWCIRTGRPLGNPFDHDSTTHLLIEHTAPAA